MLWDGVSHQSHYPPEHTNFSQRGKKARIFIVNMGVGVPIIIILIIIIIIYLVFQQSTKVDIELVNT
jgi:hypothetical protein